MSDCHYNYCVKCKSQDHHTIECTSGDRPIDFTVIATKCQQDLQTSITQEDASTQGNLINFDLDDESTGVQSSQTDYQSDLKDLLLDHANTEFGYELSPATPNYEARFQEDLNEAIRRSLKDSELYQTRKEEEMLLSDGEEFQSLHKTGTNKVMGWDAGDRNTDTSFQVENQLHQEDDPNHWETKTTPKARKNREVIPKSSLLALQDAGTPDKAYERGNPQKKTFVEAVARTLNSETNTMTVSKLRRMRRGHKNQWSYFDITPELHYLR